MRFDQLLAGFVDWLPGIPPSFSEVLSALSLALAYAAFRRSAKPMWPNIDVSNISPADRGLEVSLHIRNQADHPNRIVSISVANGMGLSLDKPEYDTSVYPPVPKGFDPSFTQEVAVGLTVAAHCDDHLSLLVDNGTLLFQEMRGQTVTITAQVEARRHPLKRTQLEIPMAIPEMNGP